MLRLPEKNRKIGASLLHHHWFLIPSNPATEITTHSFLNTLPGTKPGRNWFRRAAAASRAWRPAARSPLATRPSPAWPGPAAADRPALLTHARTHSLRLIDLAAADDDDGTRTGERRECHVCSWRTPRLLLFAARWHLTHLASNLSPSSSSRRIPHPSGDRLKLRTFFNDSDGDEMNLYSAIS